MINSTIQHSNILILDDKVANIEVLAGLLEMQGYTSIQTATDPRLAVSLFKSFKPDLILLDLMMPYLSGFEVMDQLKELIPDNSYLPILVLTADISAEIKQHALKAGAKDFLSKPFDLIEVGLRIKNLLETRFLYQQIENQNHLLEEKVKQRTSELEKTNAELIVARDKAEESDRLKTTFLNNISHEIRTPFNGILGFLPILQTDGLSFEDRELYNSVVNQSAFRLMNTIDDIVEISQIQAGQTKLTITEIDISKLFDELSYQLKPKAESKGLVFNVQHGLPGHLGCISTDSKKLNSIFFNLIGNAIKFTSAGSVELGYFLTDSRTSTFKPKASAPAGGSAGTVINPYEIQFFVKDTGVGIPENIQLAIFEKFMQADVSTTRPFDGSGLGLSIAKAYVEMLGGRIWVESEFGKGSVFYFTIPYQVKPEGEITSKKSDLTGMDENQDNSEWPGLKILIAEDDETSEIFISISVNEFSREILKVSSGAEAIEACRNNPDIDLILMDIKMPGMDGYEATRQIRQFNNEVVIIAQTAYALVGDREKASKAGCNDYISKPIKKQELNALIEKYFSH